MWRVHPKSKVILLCAALLGFCVATMACDFREWTGQAWANLWNGFIVLLILVLFMLIGQYGERHSNTGDDVPNNGHYLKDPLFGIYTLFCLSITFLFMNALSTMEYFEKLIKKKQEQKRRNAAGVLLMLGASAIVFGFLDNYGMKLGTSALEDGIFSRASDYLMGPPPNYRQLTPKEQGRVDAVKEDVQGMLGNTFSDFVGAMLGAGFTKLFEHLTSVTGDVQGDVGYLILQNPVVKVILEAVFIALGCIIPVFMEFAQKRKDIYGKVLDGSWPSVKICVFLFVIGVLIATLCILAPLPVPDADPDPDGEEDRKKYSQAISWGGVLVMIGLSWGMYRIFSSSSEIMSRRRKEQEQKEQDVQKPFTVDEVSSASGASGPP
jgi:succinate dehydrogenase hydrophobic anchor subunit